ncbi:MAG: Uma2 family endonuclease [Candidatus Eremiobacterota bacterium]
MGLSNAATRRFTADEYYLMGEAGVFKPGERVELIEGEIVPVSPQNKRHAARIGRLNTRFVRVWGETHDVRVQLPLSLPGHSEPEPDFAIVPRAWVDDAVRHPSSAHLVIELADSSLRFDRNEKASVYAKAGIPEYWVLNFQQPSLEVRLEPGPDPEGSYGYGYRTTRVLQPPDSVTPAFLPPHTFLVADLLG